jgi:hypothetical protein
VDTIASTPTSVTDARLVAFTGSTYDRMVGYLER